MLRWRGEGGNRVVIPFRSPLTDWRLVTSPSFICLTLAGLNALSKELTLVKSQPECTLYTRQGRESFSE